MDIEYFLTVITKAPFLLFYLAAFILSLIKYPKYYNSPLKYFPVVLLYTLVNETLGSFILFFKEYSLFINELYNGNNQLIFNIYSLILYVYLFYVFWKFINNEKYKQLIKYGFILFIIASTINLFASSFIYKSQNIAYVTGALILICSIVFYYKYRKEKGFSFFEYHDILSWISLGYLIFYIGYLPLKYFRYNVYNFNGKPPEPTFFRPLHYGLIIVMYTCICIGFILMKKLIVRKEE